MNVLIQSILNGYPYDDVIASYVTTMVHEYLTLQNQDTLEDLFAYLEDLIGKNGVDRNRILSSINAYERERERDKTPPRYEVFMDKNVNIIFDGAEDEEPEEARPKSPPKMSAREKRDLLNKYFLEPIVPHTKRLNHSIHLSYPQSQRVRYYNNQVVTSKGERFIEIKTDSHNIKSKST